MQHPTPKGTEINTPTELQSKAMTSLQIQIPIYQGEWEECLLSPPQETQSFPSQTRSSSASGLNPGEGAIGFLETVQKKRSPVAGGSEPSTSNALLGI